MLLALILVPTAIILSTWLYYYNTHWKKKNVQVIEESSFINSLKILFLRRSVWDFIDELYRKYDGRFRGFFMLNTPCLFVKDVKLIKSMLLKDFAYFIDRTVGRNPDADFLGAHMLFVSKGDDWKLMRTKVVPAYSTSRINSQLPLMAVVATNMTDYLKKYENQPVDVRELCAKYSTDVITSSGYGIDGRSFTNAKDSYRETTKKLFPATISRGFQFSAHFIAPFLLKHFGMTFLDKDTNVRLEQTYLEQMKKKLEIGGDNKNDFLDFIIQLCDREKNDPRFSLDHRAMISQAAQYFFAGFETVGSIFAYALFEIAKHPEVQTRLREEMKDVLSRHETVSTSTFNELEYLDMVVKETLRRYPILPFLDRKVNHNYQIPDTDVILEKGTNIYISVIGMHHDPKYFPNPHEFDPERFSKANKDKIDPFTYLPFGGGPRICIGARLGLVSVKTGIMHILKKFNISTGPDTCEKITYSRESFILVVATNVNLHFTKI